MLKRLLPLLLVPALLLGSARPAQAGRPGAVWHVVAPGETMRSIAADFGLDPDDIGRWNQISARYPLHVDATLRLTPPKVPLAPWRTSVEVVSPGMVNWTARSKCPVTPTYLRRVWVSYIDLQGGYHDGSIIVRRDVVPQVQRIFHTLFQWRYRIMAMAPMSVNMPGETNMGIVTAGYNCRPVDGTKVWSQHAYGTAIDVNPLQNPMLRGSSISPAGGSVYVKRNRYLIGMLHADGAGRAFTANGYYWGGHWNSLKDYMHFSIANK